MSIDFANLRHRHRQLGLKIEQADVVFRHDYDTSNGIKMPFASAAIFTRYEQDLQEIYQRLHAGHIDLAEAIKNATQIMEAYYEMPYPLN